MDFDVVEFFIGVRRVQVESIQVLVIDGDIWIHYARVDGNDSRGRPQSSTSDVSIWAIGVNAVSNGLVDMGTILVYKSNADNGDRFLLSLVGADNSRGSMGGDGGLNQRDTGDSAAYGDVDWLADCRNDRLGTSILDIVQGQSAHPLKFSQIRGRGRAICIERPALFVRQMRPARQKAGRLLAAFKEAEMDVLASLGFQAVVPARSTFGHK